MRKHARSAQGDVATRTQEQVAPNLPKGAFWSGLSTIGYTVLGLRGEHRIEGDLRPWVKQGFGCAEGWRSSAGAPRGRASGPW